MKKTLLVTLDFWPNFGGVANYYLNLCRHLDGDQVYILTNDGKTHKSKIQNNESGKELKIHRKKLFWKYIWPHWLPMFFYVWRIIKKEKIEKIWVGEVLPIGTVIYFLSKILKLPYIISCHGMDLLQSRKHPRKHRLAKMILVGAEYVAVNSKSTADIVKEFGIGDDKIKVIYPGVDAVNQKLEIKNQEDLLKKHGLEGKKILFSVGRLVERKGFDRVVEAMEKVIKKIPEAVYVIVGEGPEKEKLEKMINSKKEISDKIYFFNGVLNEDKWSWFGVCDVFITTAKRMDDDVEGFGIVYLEAALMGKPSIAGNQGGAIEAVVDGETGLLVDPENINEIAGAIVKLLQDKKLAEEMGEKGRLRAEKDFKWEKIIKDFLNLLD